MINVKNPALFSAAVLAYVAKAAPNGHYSYSESQWGQSECKGYYEQHGFQKEYASSCKSYYSEQYSGSWSSGDCEVLYDCWSGDELKKSYPDYYSKCSSYGGSFGGSKEVYYESKYGGGQWGESECKVYFDQYGFQKEYATACKEWYGKQWSGSCTEQECKVIYECWNGDEFKVSYPDYFTKCSSYGGSYGGGYGGGRIDKWDDNKCKAVWDEHYKKPAYLARRQGLTTTVTDIVTVPTTAPTQAPTTTVITTVITVPTSAPTSVTTSVLTSSGVTVTVTNTVTDTTKGPRPTDYPVIPIYPCDTCEKGKGHGEYIYGGKGSYGNGGKVEIIYGGNGGNGYDGSWEEYTIYCKEYNDKYHGGYNGGWNGDYKGDYDYKGNGDYKGDNKGEYPAPPKAEYPKVEPPKTSVAPKPPKTSDYPITPDVKVDCKNPSYYHHKDCIVVVSGASAMFTVAGGLMTAALALGAML